MILDVTPCDIGSTMVAGQQGIDVDVPAGGSVELSAASRPDGSPMPGHVRLLVRNKAGAEHMEFVLDERAVARPLSVQRKL